MAVAAEVGGVERGEGAAELPEGGAGGAEDHCLGHWVSSSEVVRAATIAGVPRLPPMPVISSHRPQRRPRGDRRRHPRGRAVRGRVARRTALAALVDSGEAKPGLRKVAVAHEDGRRVIVAGLGKRDELDAEKARVAAAAVAARAKELGAKSLSWAAPDGQAGRRDRRGHAARALRVRPLQVGRPATRTAAVESLEIAGDDADEAEVERRPGRSPRPQNARARPAEPALQRRHARVPGRARRGDRRRARRRSRSSCSTARRSSPGHGRVRRVRPGHRTPSRA